jgi:hypothetical protein
MVNSPHVDLTVTTGHVTSLISDQVSKNLAIVETAFGSPSPAPLISADEHPFTRLKWALACLM